MAVQQKKSAQRHGFKTGEYIVYPAHGVGQIVSIDEQVVAGHSLELFVIDFQKDKMRLKVPVAKATSIGMRKLSETDYVDPESVNAELAFARRLFADNGWPVIDVTRRSIEESALAIVRLCTERLEQAQT